MKFEEEDRFAEDRSDEGSRQLEVGVRCGGRCKVSRGG
jgi:hypothetical protein